MTTPLDFWPIRSDLTRPALASFFPLHRLGSQWLKSWTTLIFNRDLGIGGHTHIARGTGKRALSLEREREPMDAETSFAVSAGGLRSFLSRFRSLPRPMDSRKFDARIFAVDHPDSHHNGADAQHRFDGIQARQQGETTGIY